MDEGKYQPTKGKQESVKEPKELIPSDQELQDQTSESEESVEKEAQLLFAEYIRLRSEVKPLSGGSEDQINEAIEKLKRIKEIIRRIDEIIVQYQPREGSRLSKIIGKLLKHGPKVINRLGIKI